MQFTEFDQSPHDYPPPPRVHWLALFVAWSVWGVLAARFIPERYQGLLNSFSVDAWAFYLCLWIKNLNPEASSPFWCDVYVVVELSYAACAVRQNPSPSFALFTGILAMASAILAITTVFLIRRDLLKHYEEREPIGIHLSPVMTFFFSFLYFQSQLYGIAQYKKRQAEGLPTGTAIRSCGDPAGLTPPRLSVFRTGVSSGFFFGVYQFAPSSLTFAIRRAANQINPIAPARKIAFPTRTLASSPPTAGCCRNACHP